MNKVIIQIMLLCIGLCLAACNHEYIEPQVPHGPGAAPVNPALTVSQAPAQQVPGLNAFLQQNNGAPHGRLQALPFGFIDTTAIQYLQAPEHGVQSWAMRLVPPLSGSPLFENFVVYQQQGQTHAFIVQYVPAAGWWLHTGQQSLVNVPLQVRVLSLERKLLKSYSVGPGAKVKGGGTQRTNGTPVGEDCPCDGSYISTATGNDVSFLYDCPCSGQEEEGSTVLSPVDDDPDQGGAPGNSGYPGIPVENNPIDPSVLFPGSAAGGSNFGGASGAAPISTQPLEQGLPQELLVPVASLLPTAKENILWSVAEEYYWANLMHEAPDWLVPKIERIAYEYSYLYYRGDAFHREWAVFYANLLSQPFASGVTDVDARAELIAARSKLVGRLQAEYIMAVFDPEIINVILTVDLFDLSGPIQQTIFSVKAGSLLPTWLPKLLSASSAKIWARIKPVGQGTLKITKQIGGKNVVLESHIPQKFNILAANGTNYTIKNSALKHLAEQAVEKHGVYFTSEAAKLRSQILLKNMVNDIDKYLLGLKKSGEVLEVGKRIRLSNGVQLTFKPPESPGDFITLYHYLSKP